MPEPKEEPETKPEEAVELNRLLSYDGLNKLQRELLKTYVGEGAKCVGLVIQVEEEDGVRYDIEPKGLTSYE